MAKSKLVLLSGLAFLFSVFTASLGWNFYLTLAISTAATALYLYLKRHNTFCDRRKCYAIIFSIAAITAASFFYNNFYVNFKEAHPKIEPEPSRLEQKLVNFKENQINQFRINLPLNSAALLAGETFGERSDFTKELKEQMNRSGTTHIVALSGYNIAILVLAISTALGSFLSRRKTFIITAVVIILFVIMVGGGASIIRAAIMGFLILLAKELGRPYNLTNAIVLTAGIMVLINPTILTEDIGFQLSFLSLLGIVYLEPAIKKLLHLKEGGGILGWRENATMTLSAQIAVAPILIYHFNQFSLTAIPANVLILEVVPLTMFFGFFLATLSSILPVLGFLVAKLVNILLLYQIGVIKTFSSIHLPSPRFLSSGIAITIYYLALIVIIQLTFRKKTVKYALVNQIIDNQKLPEERREKT
ncbi:MAG: ComEC/Rec2 family competence protein [bacterium]|nr:ComEC/Rec2 family competence protein [bacterium]